MDETGIHRKSKIYMKIIINLFLERNVMMNWWEWASADAWQV
jgi:hypothetical protein